MSKHLDYPMKIQQYQVLNCSEMSTSNLLAIYKNLSKVTEYPFLREKPIEKFRKYFNAIANMENIIRELDERCDTIDLEFDMVIYTKLKAE